MPELPTGPYEPSSPASVPEAASPSTGNFNTPADTGPWQPGPAPQTSGAPAAQLGRFSIERVHAKGGLGQVNLARDRKLNRQVALKEIRPDRRDAEARRRFLNEAEITGQLEHPGIVPIYTLEEDGTGEPYYVMRFIQGHTLHDAIQSYHGAPTPLGFRELLGRFVSVCQTMAYAHSKGVIHRDLKPANIMVGDYGETLAVDWGLAKRIGVVEQSFSRETPASAENATQAGQIVGTPAYMSPEQARGQADDIKAPTDVYALGAILYEILTGRPPYQGTSAMEVLTQVRAGPPPSPLPEGAGRRVHEGTGTRDSAALSERRGVGGRREPLAGG